MHQPLKIAALACKFVALAYWLTMAWTVIPTSLSGLRATTNPFFPGSEPDWGTPAYTFRTCFEIAVLLLLCLLSLIPNRWLVGSRPVFVASLTAATLPLALIFLRPADATPFLSLLRSLSLFLVVSPLVLSISISFFRRHKGESVVYA
jgi:hypothetical protein